jgi:hypothetical protein
MFYENEDFDKLGSMLVMAGVLAISLKPKGA